MRVCLSKQKTAYAMRISVWSSDVGSAGLAGRGPLAGPVVAAAVLLCDGGIDGLDDSKKLSAKRRAELDLQIKARCRWGVGEASVGEIDAINILQATFLADRKSTRLNSSH